MFEKRKQKKEIEKAKLFEDIKWMVESGINNALKFSGLVDYKKRKICLNCVHWVNGQDDGWALCNVDTTSKFTKNWQHTCDKFKSL